ncbi:MAG: 5'-nucleotidase, partial [Oscillospiraceae bacterium]
NVDYEDFRDSNMGDFVADAHVYAYEKNGGIEKPIGISAKGIVRAALYTGDVTLNEAYSVASVGQGVDGTIGDPLALVYLYGNELRQTCEIVASMQSGNTQMYFSGMRYTYMNARPFGDKVIDVEVQDESGNWTAVENKRLYPVVVNLYIAQMLPVVTKQTHNLFSIVPKDRDGKPAEDVASLTLRDENGAELKDWISLVEYLQSFPKNSDGVSVIPESYRTARATKTAVPFHPAKYFTNTSKLGFVIYGALAVVIAAVTFAIRAVVKKKKTKREPAVRVD